MDVENSANESNSSPSNKAKEHNSDSNYMNGINGYPEKHKSHKSDHKDKHRDRDRDKDKERSKSKDHKSSSRDKEKDRHHSSSKDKDRHSSSHKSSSKDKDRDREKDKHRDKDKDRHRDEKKSSSSSKEKEKEHKSSHDKDKDHKSSSRDKERDKDKEKRDKERDKEKDRDKHKYSSSKDKDRDRHGSSKDKHRDKERDKHSSSKDKERKDKERKSDREKNSDEKAVKSEKEIKRETEYKAMQNFLKEENSTDDDEYKLVIKDEPLCRDEPDEANISAASSCDYNLSQFKKDESQFEMSDEEQDGYDSQTRIKDEPKQEDSDEDMPLSARMSSTSKRKLESEDDEDDLPLLARKKIKKEEEEDYKPEKKVKKEKTKVKKEPISESPSPKKGKKKKEDEQQEVWKWLRNAHPQPQIKFQDAEQIIINKDIKVIKLNEIERTVAVLKRWEEEKKDDGVKWSFLEHKGPVFAPPYEPLPSSVKFYYNDKEVKLSEPAEEVASFYARMLDHDYTTKEIFNKNFFKDWRKCMTDREQALITDLSKCNFKPMHVYFMDLAEKNRNRTKEEKQKLKEQNETIMKEYGFCTIDGHKEKIGNFKIEPPGLFRGRGEHPKMGKLKKRIEAEDVIINCSKDSKIPEPPKGHKWKEVRHVNTVTWLASWTENVQNQVKYIMLNPSSKLKGEKDWQKYETARKLAKCIDKIRREYQQDWKSKEMKIRQRAVALYFIDKLALRAGNEKDEDQADTVGCCSLRVEHIELHERKDDKDYVVVFDFLGKDSIRYYNEVPVEKRVFKNLQLFMENKKEGDDLFDRLNTQIMNKHLNELMEGLTAKVFRTYNASWTLQQQLDLLTNPDETVAEKILAYNRANRAVAILCNHQRSVPKGHEKSMGKLKEKIEAKKEAIKDAERQVKDAQREAKHGSVKEKMVADKKKKMLQRLKEQLTKLEIQETDRDENKTIALGTSKLNYLDPRISVAWCKKYDVPIEKIYNKTQRDKFRWAIDMAGPDYRF
ncbi:hypothetical protein NQ315_004716 [Exocentrus adspersus]|uniref:DNA topoisomerase I n=1 Tax=Exocentrus adspersus TaxID=1586481 RepID=A0AAV8W2R9_9CUCU|nr:hypothetical protein NQ315_004716 [Exocentrus adspersus]